jgi:hypothetical protein
VDHGTIRQPAQTAAVALHERPEGVGIAGARSGNGHRIARFDSGCQP